MPTAVRPIPRWRHDIEGMVACPGDLAYGVGKAAAVYMTRQLAVDYAKQGIAALFTHTSSLPHVSTAFCTAAEHDPKDVVSPLMNWTSTYTMKLY